ncbi:hypothetical protein C8R48DRAFT_675206 [Suillus tomentosus]|nr:hypothetical protein C8R48DRAFT_675206 [Suillus tomentosus]
MAVIVDGLEQDYVIYKNDLMDIVQAGDDPNVGDILKIEDGHAMDIDEVQGGNHGDMYTLDNPMDVDDIRGGQPMEAIEFGDTDKENLMDVDTDNTQIGPEVTIASDDKGAKLPVNVEPGDETIIKGTWEGNSPSDLSITVAYINLTMTIGPY